MPDQLFMARVKRPDGSWHFTRSASLAELTHETNARLPCDVIYQFVPDGSGFSLQPVGVFTLDVKPFQPEDLLGQVRPQAEPPAPLPVEESPYTPSGIKDEYPLTGIADQTQFVFEGPIPTKSQQELLAERGLEIPADRPVKKKRAKKPAPSFTDDDTPDDQLPNPTGRGHVQITAFSQATQAEAEAASKQIFK